MNVITGFVIGIAILALILAFSLSRMLKQYDVLLGAENIADMATALVELKRLANGDQMLSANPTDVPTTLRAMTGIGMRVIYTVVKGQNIYEHHLSLSFTGQPIAHSAGMTLAAWIAYCLGIPTEKVSVPVNMGNGSVRHIQFELSEAEQSTFVAQPVKVLKKADIKPDLWKQVMTNRTAIETNSLGLAPRTAVG